MGCIWMPSLSGRRLSVRLRLCHHPLKGQRHLPQQCSYLCVSLTRQLICYRGYKRFLLDNLGKMLEFPKVLETHKADGSRGLLAGSPGWRGAPSPGPQRIGAESWHPHLVHCAERARAQHLDLFELCLLQDPQESLVGGLPTGREGLHKLRTQGGRVSDARSASTPRAPGTRVCVCGGATRPRGSCWGTTNATSVSVSRPTSCIAKMLVRNIFMGRSLSQPVRPPNTQVQSSERNSQRRGRWQFPKSRLLDRSALQGTQQCAFTPPPPAPVHTHCP